MVESLIFKLEELSPILRWTRSTEVYQIFIIQFNVNQPDGDITCCSCLLKFTRPEIFFLYERQSQYEKSR